jgi:hypothetical protein
MNSPSDHESTDLVRAEARSRDMRRSEGLGAIIAVVAVAAVIIVGLLYILQPPAELPRRVTSEAPSAISPFPAKNPDAPQ